MRVIWASFWKNSSLQLSGMKTILLTGGTGFIGKNILESYLNNKYKIFAPKRAELDCSDDESVRQYFVHRSFDVVIHAAIKPGHRNAADATGLLYTNSRMMMNLLRHQGHWGKLLNMGSGAIYDMRHYQPKMKESYFGTYMPADEHGYTKYLFGKLLPGLTGVYDFRIFGVFGKHEDYAIRFISNVICKVLLDLPVTMNQNRKFDYLYVNDLMRVLEHFIEHDPHEKAFNITPEKSMELLEIANIIKQVSGKDIEILVAKEGYGVEYSGDNSLLKSEIKDLNFTPMRTAITELYQWYSDHKEKLNRQLLLTDK
jgi:UDP-glucose 4-epimerase